MRRATPFADIVKFLVPFFVSRQVICGAGRPASAPAARLRLPDQPGGDFFEVRVGLETALKRPIINTRDWPRADPEKCLRLHVIIGDANMSEISTYLKVGTTSLVLAMIEDKFLRADVFPGTRVLEAGAGSGVLSCWLLWAVGERLVRLTRELSERDIYLFEG